MPRPNDKTERAVSPGHSLYVTPDQRPLWTEGICGDGAAFLLDGVMVPIEQVAQALNRCERYGQALVNIRAAYADNSLSDRAACDWMASCASQALYPIEEETDE